MYWTKKLKNNREFEINLWCSFKFWALPLVIYFQWDESIKSIHINLFCGGMEISFWNFNETNNTKELFEDLENEDN